MATFYDTKKKKSEKSSWVLSFRWSEKKQRADKRTRRQETK